MKNTLYISFLVLFVSLFFACSKKDNKKKVNSALLEKYKIKIPLDNKTSFWHYSLHISKYKNKNILSFYNHFDNSVKVTEFSKQKILKQSEIKLHHEGENGLGEISQITSHLYLNKDSIYIYNPMSGRLFLINEKSNVVEKYDIVNYDNINDDVPYPEPNVMSPMLKIGNKIYFSCGLNKFQKRFSNYNVILEFNTKLRLGNYLFPFSKKYDNGFWGSQFKYLPSITYNNRKNKVYFNLPIDEHIFEGDLETEKLISIKKIKSSYISEPKPMFKNLNYGLRKNRDFNKEDIFSLSNSDYPSLLYDSYRDLYYRVVYIRPDKTKVKKGDTLANFSIITLDSKFNILSEDFFSSKTHDNSMIVVFEEGLAIARKDLYELDEKSLTFSIYEYKK